MPSLLLRINQGHDCIWEFELAAAQRFRESLALLRTRNSYGAIYLLGYSVEMWIKAAATAITMGDLHNAWNHQNAAGIMTRKDLLAATWFKDRYNVL